MVLGSEGRDATDMGDPDHTTHFLRAAAGLFANQGQPNHLPLSRDPLHEREKVQRIAGCPGLPGQLTLNNNANRYPLTLAGACVCTRMAFRRRYFRVATYRYTGTVQYIDHAILSLSRNAAVEMAIFSTPHLINTGR